MATTRTRARARAAAAAGGSDTAVVVATPAGRTIARRIVIPENVAEYYANSLNVAVSPWDFTLLFGSNTLPTEITTSPAQASEIRIDAVVRTSPQHAKAMHRALGTIIAQFEAQFGEIKIPEQVVQG